MKKISPKDLVEKTINYFKKYLEIDANQEAILRFAIEVVISVILGLVMALIPALFLGIVSNVLIIILTTAVLRSFSGGAHSSTMFGCSIYGAVIMNVFGLITKYTNPAKGFLAFLILLILMFSIWSIYKYAPADTPGKPITTKVKRQKLRRLSFLTLFLWFIVCLLWYTGFVKSYRIVYASSLGVFWQSFSLTDWGYELLHSIDRILLKIKGQNKKEEII